MHFDTFAMLHYSFAPSFAQIGGENILGLFSRAVTGSADFFYFNLLIVCKGRKTR
jgi:hypothetical protein